MLEILYDRLRNIKYKGVDSLKELDRILALINVVITDYYTNYDSKADSRKFFMSQLEEARIKNITWSPVKEINEETFDARKADALAIMEGLEKFIEIGDVNLSKEMNGEKESTRNKEIDLAILSVEQDYIEYFRSRSGQHDYQKHDRLNNYIEGGIDNGFRIIKFPDDCQLPKEIQDATLLAVKETVQRFGT